MKTVELTLSLDSTAQDECATWTIFENVPFGSPSATNWQCRPSGLAAKNTFYRNLPAVPASEMTVCKLNRRVSVHFKAAGTCWQWEDRSEAPRIY